VGYFLSCLWHWNYQEKTAAAAKAGQAGSLPCVARERLRRWSVFMNCLSTA
jgi:hypothetical protein